MDSPKYSSSPQDEDSAFHIPNLHPSQRPYTDYGVMTDDLDGVASSETFSDRIGSFVGSVSRTSLMYMAENVAVSSPDVMAEMEEDRISAITSMTGAPLTARSRCSSRRNSEGTLNERTSLLYPHLNKIRTIHSVATAADSYSVHTTQKSSFLQSVFNSINILAGVGILALPLGFKCAGWVLGSLIFAFCFGLTNYSAKILAKCLDAVPDSYTYGDMGAAAFGTHGRVGVSLFFLTELVTCSIALVVLLSDGLASLFPGHDPSIIRVACFLVLTPMLFFPVRHLSYTSLLGIFSALSIIAVVVFDGLSKTTAPGSLIEPGDTDIWPSDWMMVPMSFGLIMAGFAGHAVFPTIYRDMQNPREYASMVNWSYIITGVIYMTVAACGYRMFGSETMQEITQNLVAVPEYNQMVNRAAVWLIALNPIAKYGLTLNPVNLSWQLLLFKNSAVDTWCANAPWRAPMLSMVGKVAISALVVTLACVLPEFDKVMSLIGAFFSFMISGIFPITCYLRLYGHAISGLERLFCYVVLAIASSLAIIGTLWSFL